MAAKVKYIRGGKVPQAKSAAKADVKKAKVIRGGKVPSVDKVKPTALIGANTSASPFTDSTVKVPINMEGLRTYPGVQAKSAVQPVPMRDMNMSQQIDAVEMQKQAMQGPSAMSAAPAVRQMSNLQNPDLATMADELEKGRGAEYIKGGPKPKTKQKVKVKKK